MPQAGTVTFTCQIEYTSFDQWAADVDKHCVPLDTPYSWKPGKSFLTLISSKAYGAEFVC
jgi:hypothetical protein